MSAGARHVCVVGAGIVGCATAQALAREGWRVTLVDASASPGQGASFANGAQLSYSYVEPLAGPATLKALPGWLLSPSSPLRWRPQPTWSHLRWLAAFVAHCRSSQVHATTQALLSLSFLSRDVLRAWLQEQPSEVRLATRHARPGKLVIYRHASSRASVERQLAWQAELGCEQRIAEADECRALEPALAATGGGAIAFGVWTPSEEVVDAAALATALATASGATLSFGHEVSGLDVSQGRVRAVRLSDGGEIVADQFVLAAGPGFARLLQPLGLALPIEPIKGYSITLPIVNAAAAPVVSITDSARKLVHARLGDQLRVAGFAELCGSDRTVQPARIEALCAAVRETFPTACDFTEPQAWAGLRPATPSGRPLVGCLRWPNLWVNAGHGALGLTLAAGSATVLASLMGERPSVIDASPFQPAV